MSTSEMTVDQLNRALATGFAGLEQAKVWVDRWAASDGVQLFYKAEIFSIPVFVKKW